MDWQTILLVNFVIAQIAIDILFTAALVKTL